MKLYNNTKRQPLEQHLFAVGFVAYSLCKRLTGNNTLADAVFIAGCLHDIGKIDPNFQKWILGKKKLINDIPENGQHIETSKFSFEKYPRHNELSLLLYHLLDDKSCRKINQANKKLIRHAIYWHHAKPIRKEEITGLEAIYKKYTRQNYSIDETLDITRELINTCNNIAIDYGTDLQITCLLNTVDKDIIGALRDELMPKYKDYSLSNEEVDEYKKDIGINANYNIARTVVITSDRLVSALSKEELNAHIEVKTLVKLLDKALLQDSDLKQNIGNCLQGFEHKYPNSERNNAQKIAAKDLTDEEIDVGVLNGPAGCGKTKIALEWAYNTDVEKIIWVCPRVQVCLGLVKDLTSAEYLPNSKIEICTGEFKFIYQNGKEIESNGEFSGDIVLTTIDQVINTITTHNKVTGLVQYMNSHVVFDEYHEYINMPAFNLLFAELVKCKKLQEKNANTLLVSATPNYYFVKELLGLEDNIIGIDSFNQSEYELKFDDFDEKDESNPLYAKQPDNTFVVSNFAITAQKSFIKNQADENAILIHSKYKKSDKKDLFDKVYDNFGKDGVRNYAILRAGPIVQASLNITCDRMITEYTNAENWLQRLGRLDRFGENNEPNLYQTVIPKNLNKKAGCGQFLHNVLYCFESSRVWNKFLRARLVGNNIIYISQLYKIYQDFYNDDECIDAIEQDLARILKASVKRMNAKIVDPVDFPNKPKNHKIKSNSLRGNNRFVQMAIWNIDNGKQEFPNDYACDESMGDNYLTISEDEIKGYEDSNKDLLAFMVKKHHQIKKDAKKPYKGYILLNLARNPETPIYVSYTFADLDEVSIQQHSYAIFYAMGKNQPIGAISINKLKEK
ncbi:MAG: CRISPR-associated endonuclease Cas3'' [Thiomargarita sp.]|nr:CRISPR-associated endonuclease Cas3'' [Thiomargarita sp.]